MKASNKFFLLLGLLLLISFIIYLSSSLYQLLALSIIVAYFAYPLKNYLKPYLKNESLASLLSMAAGFLVLAVVLVVFVSSIYSGLVGITSFAADAQNINLINDTINLFSTYNIQQPLTEAGLNQLAGIMQNLLFMAPQMIISIVVFLFLLYYFIKYGEELINIIRGVIPPAELRYFDRFINRLNSMMKAIFSGQFITALVQSVILFLFMTFLKTPYAFELSFFTFIMCFFNITVTIVPIGLNLYYLYLGYATGDYFLFIITVIFTLFISTIDNVVKPIIGEKAAGFNPVFFILGLASGALTLGFTGFIIGPLLYGMLQSALEIYFEDKDVKLV